MCILTSMCVVICVKWRCNLRQVTVQSASNGVVTPFTLRGKVNGDKASPSTLCFPR
ncbi:hypothetical protein HMPREF0971_01835 [Segatella oris F0302]|uniref:Uncharacterized protein n=1 Tax=Segatella oris F0302 TaxID=649760 RepID=D1QS79_9BACT|nr:hypothetical protein HMPREF0971_01835 [Segatella oris F0302]